MLKNCVFNVSVDTKKWVKAAVVRAVKTMAQSAVAVLGTSATMSEVDWRFVVSTAALAGLLSMLTSITGIPEVEGK